MAVNILLQDANRICSQVNLDKLQDSTVLLTGSSGLIGSSFLACLCHLRKNARIKVYVLIFSDPPRHVSELIEEGNFEVIRLDLTNFSHYENLPQSDIIIHAAGYGQPGLFMNNPVATLQINTAATIALLNHLNENGHFLFLSSSEIYNGIHKPSFTEDDIGMTTPFHARASYVEGKRCGEAICDAYRLQGLHAVSARLGHTYGPGTRKHDKRALNSFIEKALMQNKIEMLDDGHAIRTYCYIADTVELLWQILLYGKAPVYNVGGKSTVTIAQLAELIGRITGVPIIIPKIHQEVSGAPEDVRLDLTRIESEFAKQEYIDLEEGLAKTIDWQRRLYELTGDPN